MRYSIKVTRLIPASPEQVFSVLSDHEGYTRFAGVTNAQLIQIGHKERNGEGAVRRMQLVRAIVFDEQILRYDAPHRMDYRIISKLPAAQHHGGSILLKKQKGGTLVQWESDFSVSLPVVGWLIGWLLKLGFKKGFSDMLATTERLLKVRTV